MSDEGVERKLTTILAADVVGYSRLMGIDEARTLAALKTHRKELIEPKAAQYHGRTIKLMGDGALMEFASVVDAVVFSVEVQVAMRKRNAAVPEDRRIVYRIGINIGDIIVEDEDIYGDGVNVAARLEGLAEPGGICVARNVFNQVKSKVELDFEDMGEQQVKNIAEPVTVYRVLLDAKAVALVTPVVQEATKSANRPWIVPAAVAVVLVAAVGGVFWWQPWTREAERASVERPSDLPAIAVLPFENMSGDPEQDYFSDGITEDLITDLSQISGLFVIARNSSFTYKGVPVKVQQVGRELGVRYVLEGSVRRSGTRIRVNAQLVDAQTGHHLWAERYDRELTEVFALQDEVTQKIVAALAIKLTRNEQDRLSRAAKVDPEAYDLVLRGIDRLVRFTPQTSIEARELFERAIAIDPGFVRAYTNLAVTYWNMSGFGGVEAPDEATRRGSEYAQIALELDPTIPQVHLALAGVRSAQRRFDEAVASARQSIELDPNYADGHGMLGAALNRAGRPEEGYQAIQMAMRLNPRHGFVYYSIVGDSLFLMGRTEEAVSAFKKAIELNPQFARARRRLAAAYGQMGRIEDAEWEAAELLTLEPDFSIARERESEMFKNPADLERYIEGLRKAGLPE
jgi:adenylate cyclase